MEKNNQIANAHNRELIRCVKVDENGQTIVKYLSAYVVKSEFLFERLGFKPDDPNLEEKLGIEKEDKVNATGEAETDFTVHTTDDGGRDKISDSTNVPEFPATKQSNDASYLIERFTGDDGTPKKKRRQRIKIHSHAD